MKREKKCTDNNILGKHDYDPGSEIELKPKAKKRNKHERLRPLYEKTLMNRRTGRPDVTKLAMIVFLCAFLFSLGKLLSILVEYRSIDSLYDEVQEEYTKRDENLIDVDLAKLRKVNKDVIGWIYIPDTNVNFPLLKGKTNKQYLFQSYKKKYLTAGSIYMDYRCSKDLSDRNTVIYGHNMHNGAMFGRLKRYAKKSYRDKHPYIYVMRQNGDWYKYSVIAYFLADITGPVYDLPLGSDADAEDMKALTETIRQENTYGDEDNMILTEYDRLLTLSTCTMDSRNDVRVVVISKLVENYAAEKDADSNTTSKQPGKSKDATGKSTGKSTN